MTAANSAIPSAKACLPPSYLLEFDQTIAFAWNATSLRLPDWVLRRATPAAHSRAKNPVEKLADPRSGLVRGDGADARRKQTTGDRFREALPVAVLRVDDQTLGL